MLNDAREAFAAALKANGSSLNATDEREIRAAAALLARAACGVDALRLALEHRHLARRERRLADDRRALVELARAHADTQPSFAADLYAAATRHGAD